ncbi:MAG: hypothetical protein ACI8X5_002320 [Planctomycetota bacterium]|jgi:hypothetical protein
MSSDNTAISVLTKELFGSIAENIAILVGQRMDIGEIQNDVVPGRIAGKGGVHISFRLGLAKGENRGHGCLLMPLPEAIALASYLLMIPDSVIAGSRKETDIDEEMKDAMLELANFVGGAVDEAYRETGAEGISVRSLGCQGVREDTPPFFPHEEGVDLIVGKASAKISEYPEFEILIMVPKSGWLGGKS